MKPKIDQGKCVGCGTCEALAGEVFEVKNDGKVVVLKTDYDNHEQSIKLAVESCPANAISKK